MVHRLERFSCVRFVDPVLPSSVCLLRQLVAQQQPPPAQRATGVVKADATAILVDVVVRDRQGDPVTGPDRRRLRARRRRRQAEDRVGVAVFDAPRPLRRRSARKPARHRRRRRRRSCRRSAAAAGHRPGIRPPVARGRAADAQGGADLRRQGRSQRDDRRVRHRPERSRSIRATPAIRRCSRRRSKRSATAARRSSTPRPAAPTPTRLPMAPPPP